MNWLWGILIIISFAFGAAGGTLEETVTAGLDGAKGAIETVMSFAGVMCLWSGLLAAAEKSGICAMIKKMLMPLISRIFPRLDRDGEAINYITLNITANLLGTGNGATPVGIKAMQELSKSSRGKPTEEMCTFTVINTAAFQLLPSSIIALRTANGSVDPFGVVLPIWICSGCALVAAVLAVKIMFRFIGEKGRDGA